MKGASGASSSPTGEVRSDGRPAIRSARPGTRRSIALGAVFAGLLLIGGGGTLVTAQAPDFRQSRVPLVGRTTTICTVAPAAGETRRPLKLSRSRPGRPRAGRAS